MKYHYFELPLLFVMITIIFLNLLIQDDGLCHPYYEKFLELFNFELDNQTGPKYFVVVGKRSQKENL